MGLLDDAIREHLELKRLRGADPGLVSREEREAFGSVHSGETADAAGAIAAPDLAGEDASPAEHNPARPDGFSNVGQETAELDMRTVLEDVSGQDAPPAEPAAVGSIETRSPSSGAAPEQDAKDDSLEWEMPRDGGPDRPDDHVEGDLPSGEPREEPVEDVLEETPDFLRDTPEQERLWFEQRPPRDFDFDK